ncbi:MAG: exodeoxyribonuclease VII large subunit [Spirochaetaceae bacterium]|nr:exodeoxyribonuclease VII large subunit [Treponema sp.]MBP3449941.1 exodeoxyribonuclease VII large subunit [Spirochaetaceae bacterium]
MTVSQLTDLIKEFLESSFPDLTIEGEISNYRPSSTGHIYFTLKDDKAAISAVMFKTRSKSLTFTPQDGMKVKVTGSLSVYAQRGSYQIIVNSMEELGTGNILQLLEERKKRLAMEGLFDSENKKSLPFFPLKIGVVTSPTGAALRDILQIVKRRNKLVSVIVLPCPVQGNDAAPFIAQQIKTANEFNLADVLIVGRGGGSLEDLLPFSEEEVVRAVAASEIPVISAVGHEIDWALSDFAADVRAPTPSAAAELAVPLLSEVKETIERSSNELIRGISTKIDNYKILVKSFSPENLELRFRSIEQPLLQRFEDAKDSLILSMNDLLTQRKQQLKIATNTLEQISPKTILERGYSLVFDEKGNIVKNANQVKPDSKIIINPAKGKIFANVESLEEQNG